MGDVRRFDLTATLITDSYPVTTRIADIAGGKGYLQLALRERGFKYVTTYDQRFSSKRANKIDYRFGLFSNKTKEEFDLLIGLHSDEATDVIIQQAAIRKNDFLIVPCCAKPTVSSYWGSNNFTKWQKHLTSFAIKQDCFCLTQGRLKFNGRNDWLRGKINDGMSS